MQDQPKLSRDKAESDSSGIRRDRIPHAPTGWERIWWLGPGFLWMVSAAGSGELLFTPRVAAQYGYTLLWALLAAVTLKWFINREIGRFAVCTGSSVLEGFKTLPGPRNWAVWLIVLPQLVVAAASIAGLASSAGTALILVLPGGVLLWMIVSLAASTTLVLYGHYKGVEWVARIIAVVLAGSSLTTAILVFPDLSEIAGGLLPSVPAGVDYGEILPWLGYMLSGAAGLMWYSYWVTAKGYGAAGWKDESNRNSTDPKSLSGEERRRLRCWITQISLDTTVAVIGALIITIAFLILGAELLRPRGLVPEESRVAEVLGVLLGGVFGPIGFWFMITATFIGFWDTVLSDQDGFGRLHANGTSILLRGFGYDGKWVNERLLKKVFVIVLVSILPVILFVIFGEPVRLLKVAGAIEAIHIPIVTGLILYLNRRTLPEELQPTLYAFCLTAIAGLFFIAFALIYIGSLIMPDLI